MITLTIPFVPTFAAIALLIALIFANADEGGEITDGFAVIGFPAVLFLMIYGLMALFGVY